MRLFELPEADLAELNALAAGGADITSVAVKNSAFYQKIQGEEALDSSFSRLLPATLVLVAQIAATSPTLHTVCFAFNNLGEHGPAVAAALTTSPTLHTVNMCGNRLSEHGPATAAALAASDTIHTVNMSCNGLSEHGPATATALATSLALHTVNMSGNNLGEHGPATATALAASDAIHTVNMSGNNLGEHGPATATALAASDAIHTVNMSGNNLGEHGPATATALAKSHTLETVNMHTDNSVLGDPAIIKAFAKSHSLIYIEINDPDWNFTIEITDRNLASLAPLAEKLIEVKDKPWFSKSIIKHLGHLGPNTKAELTKTLTAKGEDLPLIKNYLSPMYFADYFLQILGVCKVASHSEDKDLPKTTIFIGDLSPEILTMIGSFLSINDLAMTAQEEVALVGTNEEIVGIPLLESF